MTSFLDVIAFDDDERSRLARKAAVLSKTRVQQKFGSFIATKGQTALDYLEGEINEVVAGACEEVGYDNVDATLATVRKSYEDDLDAHDHDDDEDMDEESSCPACGGGGVAIGQLGRRHHYRCRHCGLTYSEAHGQNDDRPDEGGSDNPIFENLNMSSVKTARDCAICDGSGNDGQGECWHCGGSGHVEDDEQESDEDKDHSSSVKKAKKPRCEDCGKKMKKDDSGEYCCKNCESDDSDKSDDDSDHDHRQAAGAYCDECKQWGCKCGDDKKCSSCSGSGHTGTVRCKECSGTGEKNASVRVAEEDSLGGKGKPSPKIDKRKWSPKTVKPIDADGEAPNPTGTIKANEPIYFEDHHAPWNSNELIYINGGSTTREELPSETENAGFQTGGEDFGPHTKTFPNKNQADPVTAASKEAIFGLGNPFTRQPAQPLEHPLDQELSGSLTEEQIKQQWEQAQQYHDNRTQDLQKRHDLEMTQHQNTPYLSDDEREMYGSQLADRHRQEQVEESLRQQMWNEQLKEKQQKQLGMIPLSPGEELRRRQRMMGGTENGKCVFCGNPNVAEDDEKCASCGEKAPLVRKKGPPHGGKKPTLDQYERSSDRFGFKTADEQDNFVCEECGEETAKEPDSLCPSCASADQEWSVHYDHEGSVKTAGAHNVKEENGEYFVIEDGDEKVAGPFTNREEAVSRASDLNHKENLETDSTHEAAHDVNKNELVEIMRSNYDGFLPQHEVNEAISTHQDS